MVDILLATYNGEKYIREQIDSILCQSYQDIRIIIRDDGSDDDTVNIIKGYEAKFPNKVLIIEDNERCNNAASNFIQIIQYATSEYVMFCDQDDYWLPDKIYLTYNKMKEMETHQGKHVPVLVYTDVMVVDEKLDKAAKKDRKMRSFKFDITLNRLLVQNYVTGCTMMANRALYKNITVYSDEILMHDWWMALYASAFGKIGYLADKTVKYRQHGNNCIGAVDIKSLGYRLRKMFDKKTCESKFLCYKQADFFYKLFGKELNEKNKKKLERFLSIPNSKKIKKIYILISGNYLKSDFIRVLSQLVFI